MDLSTIFGKTSLPGFTAEYLHRLPYTAPQAADLSRLPRLADFFIMAQTPQVEVLADSQAGFIQKYFTSEIEIQNLLDQGGTLVIRHAEQHDDRLSELAKCFEKYFGGAVDIQLFATTRHLEGLNWHYDVEDVYLVSLQGVKEYGIRKNTVNPLPLLENLPTNMRYEREVTPLYRVSLSPGDLLYLPPGYWHCAKNLSHQLSLILSIGILSRTAMSIYDELRRHMLDSLAWRQRLPPLEGIEPEVRAAHYKQLFQTLASEFIFQLNRPEFQEKWLAASDSAAL
ncbi:MAG: cupin domain-containing protein [Pirellulales bacterium]|nr:cupin domain-containing protein [Pirellulales bacterium]